MVKPDCKSGSSNAHRIGVVFPARFERRCLRGRDRSRSSVEKSARRTRMSAELGHRGCAYAAAALSVERVTPDPPRVTTCASRRGPALRCASHDRIAHRVTLNAGDVRNAHFCGLSHCRRQVRLLLTPTGRPAAPDAHPTVSFIRHDRHRRRAQLFSARGSYVRLPAARSMAMAGGSTWDANMRICRRESQSTL